jgi:cell division protein FtsI (penicillin-binding protein 3)
MSHRRLRLTQILILVSFGLVIARLFYWQVVSRASLQALAQVQYQSTITLPAQRGQILSSDGYPLVSNQPAFLVYAYTPDLEHSPLELADSLSPLLAPSPESLGATPSAQVKLDLAEQTKANLVQALNNPQELSWIPLNRQVSPNIKQKIEALDYPGIGFESYQIRLYPEASLSSQLAGFVGSDGTGKPKGYFGLEGYYDLELSGRPGIIRQEKDAFGRPIVIGEYTNLSQRQGRTLHTSIDRGLQLLAKNTLLDGLQTYGAVAGEVVIMDPNNGRILTLVSLPDYDPANYKLFPKDTFKISSIADTYEPGSTFKIMVMAAAINEGVVTPESTCDQPCSGPITIGKYTIGTWDDSYHPGQTMAQIIERSDNVGMVYVANQLGKNKFIDYLNRFGIGRATNIDLESETAPPLRSSWGDIDLATGSFGQGLVVNSLQMTAAVSAIANGGKLYVPHVVKKVETKGELISIPPQIVSHPITPKTAKIISDMMVGSATHGEARWRIPAGYTIAGKTGTAQIPIAGHYDTEKTIASFVGFAPAHDPQFVMLVKLKEPQSSPWASETAAPLWFDLAHQVLLYLNIPPEN